MKTTEKQWDAQMTGTINVLPLSGWHVIFDNDGKYWVRDDYHNYIYLCNYNSREKLFDFLKTEAAQFGEKWYQLELAILKYFKRTKTQWFKQVSNMADRE